MKKNSNFFTIIVLLSSTIFVCIFILLPYYKHSGRQLYTDKKITTTVQSKPTLTIDDYNNWETYESPVHPFSFQHPPLKDYEIYEESGPGFTPGTLGSSLKKTSHPTGLAFNVYVFYTQEFTTIGNRFGDVDAFENGFQYGGVKEVARLSREVNLQKLTQFPDKQVGELVAFNYANGTGYGFTVTDWLKIGFKVNGESKSGMAIKKPLTVVYVTNGQDIYRIGYPTDSIGGQVFSTFKFTK